MSALARKKCPKCNLQIAEASFEWHLKNGHDEYFVGEDQEEYYEDLDDAYHADFLQKNIDATRLYAHSYRETGKYGSHSGHDGYDDESDP